MIQEMFTSSNRPFYHSADMLELNAIAPGLYIPFLKNILKQKTER